MHTMIDLSYDTFEPSSTIHRQNFITGSATMKPKKNCFLIIIRFKVKGYLITSMFSTDWILIHFLNEL